MNSTVSRLRFSPVFLAFVFIFFGCTKITTTNIGSGLLPPIDGVKTFDTVLEVVSKNAGFDSVVVGISDDHALGYVSNDPVFGKTIASINFQISPPYFPLSFGADKDHLYLDSVVLALSFKGSWGDTFPHQLLRVYQMESEELFSNDSAYNNTISFEKGQEITEGGVPKDVDITKLDDPDTLTTYHEVATRTIRIRLSQAFGEKLLKVFDSSNAYQDDSTFHNYVKGLIVEPEQSGTANSLLLVNLLDTSTRLSLYYRFQDTAGNFDTTVRRFAPNVLTSASSNTIIHNYQNTAIPSFFPPNSDPEDSLIFIQTSPGTYAKLKVIGLDSLPNVIVHRAEFLMEQVPDLTSMSDTYFRPPNLFLACYSDDSMRRFSVPFDVTFTGSGISGQDLVQFGILPVQKGAISAYNFEVTRYVQSIVTRQNTVHDFVLWAPYNDYIYPVETAGFTLPISTPAINAAGIGRVRLGGGSNAQHKMRLHIVYSLLQ